MINNKYVNIDMNGDFDLLFYAARRNCGKTTAMLIHIIENKLPTMWVRRRKVEIDEFLRVLPKHWLINDNKDFKVNNGILYYKNKILIVFTSLSTQHNITSINFDFIKLIVFDEYISRNRYLKDEMIIFSDFLLTIIRSRKNVKTVLLANTISKNNPLFNELDVKVDEIKTNEFYRWNKRIKIVVDNQMPPEPDDNLPEFLASLNKDVYGFMYKGEFSLDNLLDRNIDRSIIDIKNATFWYNIIIDNISIDVKFYNETILLMPGNESITSYGATRLDSMTWLKPNVIPPKFWDILYKYIVIEHCKISHYHIKDAIYTNLILYLGKRNERF